MHYKKKVLKNGLRIIAVPLKDNETVTVAVFVEAGSKYETKAHNGISHFLEHMCFKGTVKRPTANDIALAFDSIGAENNAFTSTEYTGYYGKGEARHFKTILDIVSDMYVNPTLPPEEIERERGVIIEEINMYEDEPRRLLGDYVEEVLYGDQPAGWRIIGTKENIRRISRKDFVTYRKNNYVASATTVVVSGAVTAEEVFRAVPPLFKDVPSGRKHQKKRIVEKQKAPVVGLKEKKTDQAHFIVALRALSVHDKDTFALGLLATVLGQGMSSRLWRELREKRGLCYYTSANPDLSTDHGYLAIRAGVGVDKIYDALRIVMDELRRMRTETVSAEELQKAKDFKVGHMKLATETSDAFAFEYGLKEVLGLPLRSPDEEEQKIRSITSTDIARVAKRILKNEHLNLAVIGPYNDKKQFQKLLRF